MEAGAQSAAELIATSIAIHRPVDDEAAPKRTGQDAIVATRRVLENGPKPLPAPARLPREQAPRKGDPRLHPE